MTPWEPSALSPRPSRRVLAASLLGLAVFLAWQAWTVKSFVGVETRPPAWDQAIHMEIALDYRRAIAAGRWEEAFHLRPKPGMPPFPPLYHLLLSRAYSSENPAGAALWVNWLYLALLCLSLFAIAYEFRPDSTALAGVLIFACAPEVQRLLLTQLIDLPVAALAAAAVWALLRSEGFRRWGPSLGFGLLYALGMMHKWSFFTYMLPAYAWAVGALLERESRWKALAALLVAAAGCLPWYLAHLPVMLPRLLEASADFAVPVWKGGAFFAYLWAMAEGLGPPFWLLALIGLLVPSYGRNAHKAWVIPAWVVSSYLFWAVVPNRQLRFLLPGLPGLAVACGAWPRPVLWGLAAFQVFGAANLAAGWVGPLRLHLPFQTLTFLPGEPPASEDWKIPEILREAQARREPDSPVSNLTLVANAPRFNGPNFTWLAKALELPNVRLRGVNRRLCELSEFVVLKSRDLGPPGVISGLPEAARAISEPRGWFSKGYAELRRWSLPDASEAILFQRRRLPGPPIPEKSLTFQLYETGPFKAQGLRIALGGWDREAAAYPLVRVEAAEVELRGLRLTGLSIELEGLAFVPLGSGPAPWDDLRFLRLGRLRLKSARLSGEDLKRFLEAHLKGLKVRRLELERNLRLEASFRGLPLSAEASLSLEGSPRSLRLEILKASLGPAPLPLFLLRGVRTLVVPLEPNPETPFAIEVAGLRLQGGRLTIP